MDEAIWLEVHFYRRAGGNEPVREWLKSLSRNDKRTIGEDMKTVQFGWPLGMPLVRSLGKGLWEVRSWLENGKIARIIFFLYRGAMILVNGFIKKTQKTPANEIMIADKRKRELESKKLEVSNV